MTEVQVLLLEDKHYIEDKKSFEEGSKPQYKCIHFSIPKDENFLFASPFGIEDFGLPITEKPHFKGCLQSIEKIVKDSYPQIKHVGSSVDNSTQEYIYSFLDKDEKPLVIINIYFAYPRLVNLVEKKLNEGLKILNSGKV